MYNRADPEYQKRECEICDKIREALDEIGRIGREGKDTTETFQRLEAALDNYWNFREKYKIEKNKFFEGLDARSSRPYFYRNKHVYAS